MNSFRKECQRETSILILINFPLHSCSIATSESKGPYGRLNTGNRDNWTNTPLIMKVPQITRPFTCAMLACLHTFIAFVLQSQFGLALIREVEVSDGSLDCAQVWRAFAAKLEVRAHWLASEPVSFEFSASSLRDRALFPRERTLHSRVLDF